MVRAISNIRHWGKNGLGGEMLSFALSKKMTSIPGRCHLPDWQQVEFFCKKLTGGVQLMELMAADGGQHGREQREPSRRDCKSRLNDCSVYLCKLHCFLKHSHVKKVAMHKTKYNYFRNFSSSSLRYQRRIFYKTGSLSTRRVFFSLKNTRADIAIYFMNIYWRPSS